MKEVTITIDDKFLDLKPIKGEEKYVTQLTEEQDGLDGWGILGCQSGFCYETYLTKEEAERNIQ